MKERKQTGTKDMKREEMGGNRTRNKTSLKYWERKSKPITQKLLSFVTYVIFILMGENDRQNKK